MNWKRYWMSTVVSLDAKNYLDNSCAHSSTAQEFQGAAPLHVISHELGNIKLQRLFNSRLCREKNSNQFLKQIPVLKSIVGKNSKRASCKVVHVPVVSSIGLTKR